MKNLPFVVFVLLSLFFLTGCGPSAGPVICTSYCGMRLLEPPENRPGTYPWTCEEFQAVETATVMAFETMVLDPRFSTSCEAVAGWRVYVHEEVHWTQNGSGVEVAGETFCVDGMMAVNNVSPMASSLPHEMAHVVQKCNPIWEPPDEKDPQHQGWGRHLVDDDGNLIRDANNRPIWEPQWRIYEAIWEVVDTSNHRYESMGYGSGY